MPLTTKPVLDHLKREKTQKDIRGAVREVKTSVRPRNGSLREIASLLFAVGAGVGIAWRSFQAGRDPKNAGEANTSPATLGKRNEAASKGDKSRSKASSPVADKSRANAKTGPAVPQKTGGKSADSHAPAVLEKVESRFGIPLELWKRMQEDEVFTRAQALSFIGLLSLVPLLLFVVAAVGFLIQSPQEGEDLIRRMAASIMPGQQGSQAINEFIQNTNIAKSAQTLIENRWSSVIIGVGSLVYAVMGLFVSATDPMNKAWDVQETRNFLQLRGVAFGVFLGAIVFFALSLFVTSGAHGALASLGIPNSLPLIGAFLVDALFFVLAVLVNTILFTLIYRFLPNAPVTWKAAAFGGAIVGVLWEVFKQAFAYYLAHFANMDKTYGTLTGVILLVTWIFYTNIILLAGAEIGKMYHEHKEEGGVNQRASA